MYFFYAAALFVRVVICKLQTSSDVSLLFLNVFILPVNRATAINIAHQMAPLYEYGGSVRGALYCLLNIDGFNYPLPGFAA